MTSIACVAKDGPRHERYLVKEIGTLSPATENVELPVPIAAADVRQVSSGSFAASGCQLEVSLMDISLESSGLPGMTPLNGSGSLTPGSRRNVRFEWTPETQSLSESTFRQQLATPKPLVTVLPSEDVPGMINSTSVEVLPSPQSSRAQNMVERLRHRVARATAVRFAGTERRNAICFEPGTVITSAGFTPQQEAL